MIEAIADHPKICKHVHLPLQAGNDRILELMNRTYISREYLTLVSDMRRRIPGVALTTDIICGFCSETEEEFLDTYRTMEDVGFHSAFIFKYSERKNTIAGRKYRDDVPDEIKSNRVARLVELQREVSRKKNEDLVGQTLRVMVEGNAKKSQDQWMGRTDTNITVVWQKDGSETQPGDIIPIAATGATAATLIGKRS